MSGYNPTNWYWFVGNKTGVVFSSASAAYVAPTDPGYLAFLAAGGKATSTLCDGELADVLTKSGAPPATVVAAGFTSLGGLTSTDATNVMVAMGCAVVSTGTPALSATYAVDKSTQAQITAESVYLQVTGAAGAAKFTNGQPTKAWPDLSGAMHTFTTTEFIAFAEAIGQFVDALATAGATLAAGGQPAWPSQPVTIA